MSDTSRSIARAAGRRRKAFPPVQPKAFPRPSSVLAKATSGIRSNLKDDYEGLVFAWLRTHAFRVLNREHDVDHDTLGVLTRTIRLDAINAADLVRVRFVPGRRSYTDWLEGRIPMSYLERTAAQVAEWTIENWDPQKADALRARAAKGGAASSRSTDHTLADLEGVEHWSRPAQAAHLGFGPGEGLATVDRLRRDGKALGLAMGANQRISPPAR